MGDWLLASGQAIGWIGLSLIMMLLGMHAFHRHKRETKRPMSASRLIYWLYSLVFFALTAFCSAQVFVELYVGTAAGWTGGPGFPALLIGASYIAVALPARSKRP